MSTFWSVFVILLVLINVVGCLIILQLTRHQPADEPETTGHVWDDDIREYNKPLPRWWLNLFIITIIYSAVYLTLYPGFGAYEGLLGWTQTGQYDEEVAEAREKEAAFMARFEGMDLMELSRQPEIVSMGSNVFANNCATCHGSDARGALGYPNLRDDDWLYGGAPENILQTLNYGRNGVMPALGAALGDEGLEQVIDYVLTLSGAAEVSESSTAGQQKFTMFCVSCHGMDAKGNIALGAPNLTNGIWLHGGSRDQIRDVIVNGRVNQMPAQQELLGESRIQAVTAWILSLQEN